MALLDHCELLALLRTEEKNGKEEDILKEEKLRKEALRQASELGDTTNHLEKVKVILKEKGEKEKEENLKEKEVISKEKDEKEEKLRKEALRQASLLGDSALYRCHKKCARIKQLTGAVPKQ